MIFYNAIPLQTLTKMALEGAESASASRGLNRHFGTETDHFTDLRGCDVKRKVTNKMTKI